VLVRYDAEADATCVQLDAEATVARTVDLLDGYLLVDVDGSGHPIGTEVLSAPAEVDELAMTALALRFPYLNIRPLCTALAGRKAATG
jgi:uncharacterized protein YuzE